jgi:hypothetical protein
MKPLPLRAKRALLPALTAVALTACGGGGLPVGSVVNSPGGGPSSPPTQLVDVTVTVTVPAAKRAHRMHSQYVSANTQSLVVQLASVDGNAVTGVNPTTINTLPSSHGCKSSAGGTVCTKTAQGSPGSDVFSVTTYSGEDATGSVLSVGTVQARIGGQGGNLPINNKVSLTLYGVIASIKLTIAPNGAKRGDPTRADAALSAFDASGAQIVGPSDYATPISLTIEGDTSNAFLLHDPGRSGTTLQVAKPTSKIFLSYDGNTQASSITVQATAGTIGTDKNFTLHGKQPPPPVGTIYVLNLGSNEGKGAVITEYDGKAKGDAAPERTLSLSTKLYARSIAVDSSGNLYVGYLDNDIGYNTGTGQPDAANEIAIYAAGASGNDQPSAVLNSNSSTSSNLYPIFTAIDPSGRLVSYGATSVDGNDPVNKGAVLTYAANPSGTPSPQYAFNFASPFLKYNNAGPTGLAIDSENNFYVNGKLEAGFGSYDYGLFVALASDIDSPSAKTAREIAWNSTSKLSQGQVSNVALDAQGEIYIGNFAIVGTGSTATCQGEANVFSAGYSGSGSSVSPTRILTLSGVSSKESSCVSSSVRTYFPTVALYETSLFVADPLNNAIDAFSSRSHGTVKPFLQIAGSSTQLDAPIAVVVTSVSGSAAAGPVAGSVQPPVRPSVTPDAIKSLDVR